MLSAERVRVQVGAGVRTGAHASKVDGGKPARTESFGVDSVALRGHSVL